MFYFIISFFKVHSDVKLSQFCAILEYSYTQFAHETLSQCKGIDVVDVGIQRVL